MVYQKLEIDKYKAWSFVNFNRELPFVAVLRCCSELRQIIKSFPAQLLICSAKIWLILSRNIHSWSKTANRSLIGDECNWNSFILLLYYLFNPESPKENKTLHSSSIVYFYCWFLLRLHCYPKAIFYLVNIPCTCKCMFINLQLKLFKFYLQSLYNFSKDILIYFSVF